MSEIDETLSGFIACIPHEIQANGDAKYGPLLADFLVQDTRSDVLGSLAKSARPPVFRWWWSRRLRR
jgi:hypothetical protein